MKLKINKHKSFIVAEIGWNFLGNINLAKKMIMSAKKSGADAVKFQIWNPVAFEERKEVARKSVRDKGLTLPRGNAKGEAA